LDKCVFLKEQHMNETKVNTNIGDVSSPGSKKAVMAKDEARAKALAHFEASAAVSMTNGVFLIDPEFGAAQDHANMRAGQLSSLLMLMRGDDAQGFRRLADRAQQDLMWLASQLADEVEAMLPIIADEVRKEGRA
jgi:hypothetical protein